MNKKPFLCFWKGDGGDRESYNVYYSVLVYAKDKEEALDKYLKSGKAFASGRKEYYEVIDFSESNDIIE